MTGRLKVYIGIQPLQTHCNNLCFHINIQSPNSFSVKLPYSLWPSNHSGCTNELWFHVKGLLQSVLLYMKMSVMLIFFQKQARTTTPLSLSLCGRKEQSGRASHSRAWKSIKRSSATWQKTAAFTGTPTQWQNRTYTWLMWDCQCAKEIWIFPANPHQREGQTWGRAQCRFELFLFCLVTSNMQGFDLE